MSESLMYQTVLLVEGKDEINFFRALLKDKFGTTSFEVSEIKNGLIIGPTFNDAAIRIEYTGGKDQFPTLLAALKDIEWFNEVEVLAIVRDADTSSKSTFDSIVNVLKDLELPYPDKIGAFTLGSPRVGVFIMPGNDENGALEDLCLQTQADHPAMECVDTFFQCLATLDTQMPRNISKAKCQVFLAAMPTIVSSVGLGALKGYWDLRHQCMDSLDEFVQQMGKTGD